MGGGHREGGVADVYLDDERTPRSRIRNRMTEVDVRLASRRHPAKQRESPTAFRLLSVSHHPNPTGQRRRRQRPLMEFVAEGGGRLLREATLALRDPHFLEGDDVAVEAATGIDDIKRPAAWHTPKWVLNEEKVTAVGALTPY